MYSRIILPLSRPALMMVAIFVFNITWNDFFGPLIYLHSQRNYTIALGLLFDTLHPRYAGVLGLGPNPKLIERARAADLIVLIGGEAVAELFI